MCTRVLITHAILLVSLASAAVVEPYVSKLANLGFKESFYDLNLCQVSFTGLLVAMSCNKKSYDVDFFLDEMPASQNLYVMDMQSMLNNSLEFPKIYYINNELNKNESAKSEVIVRENNGGTSQMITYLLKTNESYINLTQFQFSIEQIYQFSNYVSQRQILAGVEDYQTSTDLNDAPAHLLKTYVKQDTKLIALGPDEVLNDIYQDEFIRIEHKTYSSSSDKIILRCCNSNDDLAFKHFAQTIQTDIYQNKNSMKFLVIQQGKDFQGENGNSYKLVVFDKDRLDPTKTSFSINLYKFDVYGAPSHTLRFNGNPQTRYYNRWWAEEETALSWDFMSIIADNNRVKVFKLDGLIEIQNIKNLNYEIQRQYGIKMIQRRNLLMEFHVEKAPGQETAYIVMNKLLFVQSGAGIFPNFEQHDYPKTFQWILQTKVSIIKLNWYTQIQVILDGASIGWLEKFERKFESLRICSHSEMYNAFTNECQPCDTGPQTSDNLGTFSAGIQSPTCFGCSDLSQFETSDPIYYLELDFICNSGVRFTHFSSAFKLTGAPFVPTERDEASIDAEISTDLQNIKKKTSMSQRGLIIALIVVGLVVLCCLLLWILWTRIKIEDDETDMSFEVVDPEQIRIEGMGGGPGDGQGGGGYGDGSGNGQGGTPQQWMKGYSQYEIPGMNNVNTSEKMLMDNMNAQYLNLQDPTQRASLTSRIKVPKKAEIPQSNQKRMLDTIRDLKKKLIQAQKNAARGSIGRKGSGSGPGGGGGGDGKDDKKDEKAKKKEESKPIGKAGVVLNGAIPPLPPGVFVPEFPPKDTDYGFSTYLKPPSLSRNPAIPPLPPGVFVPPFPPPDLGYLPYLMDLDGLQHPQLKAKTSSFTPRKPLLKIEPEHKLKQFGWKRVVLDPEQNLQVAKVELGRLDSDWEDQSEKSAKIIWKNLEENPRITYDLVADLYQQKPKVEQVEIDLELDAILDPKFKFFKDDNYTKVAILLRGEGFPNSEKNPKTAEELIKALDTMELKDFGEEQMNLLIGNWPCDLHTKKPAAGAECTFKAFMAEARTQEKDKEFRYTEAFMFKLGQKTRLLDRVKLRVWMLDYQKQSNILTNQQSKILDSFTFIKENKHIAMVLSSILATGNILNAENLKRHRADGFDMGSVQKTMQFKDKNKDEMLYNMCTLIYAEDPSFKDIKESFKTVYEYKHFNAKQIAVDTEKLKKEYEMYSASLEKITQLDPEVSQIPFGFDLSFFLDEAFEQLEDFDALNEVIETEFMSVCDWFMFPQQSKVAGKEKNDIEKIRDNSDHFFKFWIELIENIDKCLDKMKQRKIIVDQSSETRAQRQLKIALKKKMMDLMLANQMQRPGRD